MTVIREIIEDAELAALVNRDVPVTFVVLEDEWKWNEDGTSTRVIKRAKILSVSPEPM